MAELKAHCKINLGLRVLRRRADGFHDIETVMMAVPGIYDTVSVEAVATVSANAVSSLEVTGARVDCPPEENICMKALRLLQREYGAEGAARALAGRMGEARVRLHKVVPSGAGLGGGSADGAAVLVAADGEFALGVSAAELERLAAMLGSDVPFFVRCGARYGTNVRGENTSGRVAHGNAQFCTGRGEVMTPVEVDLVGLWLAVVKPPTSVSTAEAYAGVTPHEGGASVAEIVRRPVAEWCGVLRNDFEESVFARHPEIGVIKQRLYEAGAVYASMSGSGSALFGLFDRRPDLSALEHGSKNALFIHVEKL